MFDFLEKKLENIFALMYLLVLRSHDLENNKKITRIQNKKVRKLMKHAYNIPFYRKKFDEVGLTPKDFMTADDLLKFPVLTKQEIREWILPEVNKNPSKYKYWREVTTSGSSGTPLSVFVSPKENAMLTANWIRIGMCNGFNPIKDKTMALKDPKIIEARKGKDSIVQKFGFAKRYCISSGSDGKTILQTLNNEKPDYIYIQRSKLIETLIYAKKNNLPLHKPKLCGIIGEGIDENSKDLIFEFLKDVLFTSYGSQETGACTYTKKGTIDKHVVTRDTHVINILKQENGIFPMGGGKMLLTNLFYRGFPIINYDINDAAEIVVENNIPYLCNIKGRLNDMLYFSDGSTTDYHAFYFTMEKRKNILQFRVIQESYEKIIIQLVKNFDTEIDCPKIEEEILEDVSEFITDKKVKYEFEWLDELVPDENGKRRFIISKVNK